MMVTPFLGVKGRWLSRDDFYELVFGLCLSAIEADKLEIIIPLLTFLPRAEREVVYKAALARKCSLAELRESVVGWRTPCASECWESGVSLYYVDSVESASHWSSSLHPMLTTGLLAKQALEFITNETASWYLKDRYYSALALLIDCFRLLRVRL